jgi:hypothetical protein
VLLISKIHELPGAGAGAGASGSAKTAISPKANGAAGKAVPAASTHAAGKPNGKAAPASGDDLDGNIISALQLHFAENDAPIPGKDIAKIVFTYFKKADNGLVGLENKAVARASKQDFRQSLNESGFVYDGSTLALAE